MSWFWPTLVCYGLTFLIRDSVLLRRPRRWLTARSPWFADLFECAFCTGFWASLAVLLLLGRTPVDVVIGQGLSVILGPLAISIDRCVSIFLSGLGLAGAVFVIDTTVVLLESWAQRAGP